MALGSPEGSRLQIIHDNAPGLVSRISAVISREKLNIVNMLNKSRGEVAVTVLEVSEAPGEALLAELSALEQVARVRLVTQ